jgi:predicted O-linked N-acetylglucosamine transferase (SPINDLY family)
MHPMTQDVKSKPMSAQKNSTPASPKMSPAAPFTTGQDADTVFELATKGTLSLIDLFNAAQNLVETGQRAQAVALYRLWIKSTKSPLTYAVYFNLGATLSNLQDDVAAEQAYRSALSLKPDFIEARLNLGSLQERQSQPELALDTWHKALEIINPQIAVDRPFYTQTLNNLGRLLEIRKCYPQAEDMLRRSLEIDPKQPNAITHWVHLRQKQCKWPIYSRIEGVTTAEMVNATSALAMLSASGDPAVQLAAARRYVEDKVLSGVAPLSQKGSHYGHQRLRIAYLSSDFCSHAVSLLTAELFELHDRSKVEVYGFCWSREDGSPLRARVVKAMDHHIRIGAMGDEEAARCIRSHEIDILIDLHGLTLGARQNIFSYRPAPVQISYLGFPGPTALPCIDYVLSDQFVLPPELAPFFTEKPLYLPNTFQVNDRQRAIGPRPSKASCGLPEDAFIFCSFNNNHKFTPEVFACWMRILQRSPSSVLWLIADSEEIRETLWQQAEQHGVPRARLVFAGRVMAADYLARYQVADLFLDTLPFNAGTTASDALWAGLPLLTCAGATFASRMAGSLLRAADLPQLITYNLQDYEDKAVELAAHPERIAAMKQQLADERLSCALFDSPRFVRDLEVIYGSVAVNLAQEMEQTSINHASNMDAVNSTMDAGRAFAVAVRNHEVIKQLAKSIEDHQAGYLAEANQGYRRVLSVEGNNLVALNNLSLLVDDASAFQLLQRALEVTPDYPDALINISSRCLALLNVQEAEKYIDRALAIAPHDVRVQELHRQLISVSEKQDEVAIQSGQTCYTVIIPTHRRAKLLDRALSSIKNQAKAAQHEIIVVSDCADSDTDDVCRKWLQPTDTYVRRSGAAGPSASRNLALKLAKGRTVLFLDDDDAWHPNLLASLDVCEPLKNGLPVYFNCTVVKEARKQEGPEHISDSYLDNAGRLDKSVFIKNQVHMSCFAMPRTLIQELEFDSYMRAYEDWDFLLSVFERTMPIHVPILGSRVYEVDDVTTDRRGSSKAANDANAAIDYLYVYRRHPVPRQLQEQRAALLVSSGLTLTPDLL